MNQLSKRRAPLETQAFHDEHTKRAASPRQVMWGTYRTKHAKPSTVRFIRGNHVYDARGNLIGEVGKV